jgi:hypothetical protein
LGCEARSPAPPHPKVPHRNTPNPWEPRSRPQWDVGCLPSGRRFPCALEHREQHFFPVRPGCLGKSTRQGGSGVGPVPLRARPAPRRGRSCGATRRQHGDDSLPRSHDAPKKTGPDGKLIGVRGAAPGCAFQPPSLARRAAVLRSTTVKTEGAREPLATADPVSGKSEFRV